jgi:hypothetical protein
VWRTSAQENLHIRERLYVGYGERRKPTKGSKEKPWELWMIWERRGSIYIGVSGHTVLAKGQPKVAPHHPLVVAPP